MSELVPGPAVGALALAWAAVVAEMVLRRTRRATCRALDGANARSGVPAGGRGRSPRIGWPPDAAVRRRQAATGSAEPSARSPVVALGAAVRRLQARLATPRRGGVGDPDAGGTLPRTRPDGVPTFADRRAGWATLAGIALAALAPALAGVALAWAMCGPVVAARRRAALADQRLHDQLPDVVDLLALTAAAGLPVGAALVAIGGRPGGPVGAALAGAAAHVRHGGTTAGALDRLAAAGPAMRPLVEALAQHDRYGTPLVPALDRVAIEARARRRRRSEEAARRLPVTLLLPLVLTTFPAFVLLTVVPLLAGSLGSLSLSPT